MSTELTPLEKEMLEALKKISTCVPYFMGENCNDDQIMIRVDAEDIRFLNTIIRRATGEV